MGLSSSGVEPTALLRHRKFPLYVPRYGSCLNISWLSTTRLHIASQFVEIKEKCLNNNVIAHLDYLPILIIMSSLVCWYVFVRETILSCRIARGDMLAGNIQVLCTVHERPIRHRTDSTSGR